MTTFTWKSGTSGDWSVAADWSPAGPANSASADAVIGGAGGYTVSIAAGESFLVDSLKFAPTANATLSVVGTLTLGGALASMTIGSGIVKLVGGTIAGGTITMTGGTLAGSASSTVGSALVVSAGTLTVASATTLTLAGATTLTGGALIKGPGTLSTTGTTTISGNAELDGGLVWLNAGTVSSAGQIYTGYPSGTGKVTITNLAGGAFNLTADGAAFNVYSPTLALSNAGVLSKTGGTGTSSISVAVANTGTITATSGTLELDGGGTLSGTMGATGAGALALASGTYSLGGATQTVSGALLLDGGTVSIGSGKTLTLSGGVAWSGSSDIIGPGTLATTGTDSLSGNVYLDGALTWSNTGTVIDGAATYVGANGGTLTEQVINQATGTYDIAADTNTFYNYVSTTFTNAGLLEKTGNTATTQFYASLTNTGTLAVTSGTLNLDSGASLGGTIIIGASGSLVAQSGTFAVSGTFANAGSLVLQGSVVTVGPTAESIGGAVALTGSTLDLASGQTLTLAGPVTWSGSNIAGPGTLATTGTTNVSSTVYLDGGVTWSNSGTVLDATYSYSGANSSSTDAVVNQVGGIFDFTADDYAFYNDAPTTFTNAGLLEKTGTTGNTQFYASLANTGTVTVASGTLDLDSGASLGGTVGIASGTGLALQTGTFSIGGTVTDAGTLLFAGTSLAVTGTLTNTGTMTLQNGAVSFGPTAEAIGGTVGLAGSTLNLASDQTLTLSGGVAWSGSDINGPGTLATTGTTTLSGSVYLDGGVAWSNSGTVIDGAYSYNGLNSGGASAVVNQAAGVFDITADDFAFNDYGNGTTFTNAGLLEKTGTTGITQFYASLNSTGVVTAASGTLDLDSGATLSGSISVAAGASLGMLGGNFVLGGTGTLANAGTVVFAGTSLALNGVLTNSGTLLLNSGYVTLGTATSAVTNAVGLTGSTLDIASNGTLTLSGPVTWNGSAVYGPGTLATTGTVTVSGSAFLERLTWSNSGTVIDGAYSYNGLNSSGASAVVNQAAGVFDITANDFAFNDYGNGTTFSNAGLLEKTGTTGTTQFYASLTNGGTVTVASGTLDLDNGAALGGTVGIAAGASLGLQTGTFSVVGSVTNSGTVLFTGASLAVTGTVTNSGTLLLQSGAVTLGPTAEVIAGAVGLTGSTLDLASGQTLTLSGPVTWNGGDVTGPGTLATTGITTLSRSVYLDGSLTWINSGTVIDGTSTYSGENQSGTDAVVNQTGGTFDITADAFAFYNRAPTTFTNAGLLEKTGTTGTTNFYAGIVNTGTITATSGTLELDAGGTLNGIVGGTGTGNVLLGYSQVFSTTGTLAVTDAGTVDNGLRIAYSDVWTVTGTVNDAGRIQVGNNTGTAGTLAIAAGAHFNLTSNDATLLGNGKWVVTNAGILAGRAATGTATISLGFTNTGTVDAASGTLKLAAGVGGSGQLRIESGATLELAAATVPGSNTIDFAGLGATLKLDANFAPTTTIVGLGAGSRIDLLAASSATAVVSGATLTITPSGGSALNFVGSASLAGLHVATGSDGAGGSVVTLYQLASAAHAPEPVAFGSVHVGDVVQQAVTLTNTGTAGAYTEALDASLTANATGFTASGSLTGLGGGASNGSALSVALNTATAGTIGGAGTLTLASDGTGIDGYGQTALASQTVNVTGAVYAYAAPVLSAGSIALGATRVGGTALAGSVVLADGTAASAYQESLLYQLGTALPGSLAVSNAGGTLVAGQTVAIGVTLSTGTAGDFTGTALGSGATGASFVSTGAGTSGLANTTLATPTLTVSGQVYATATASLSATVVNFGAVHVGDVVNAATLTLTNAATGALTDSLTGGTVSQSGAYAGTVTPSIGGGLAAGAAGSVTFGLATGSAGSQNGTVNLGFLSHDAVLSDLAVNAAPVSVTAAVYAYAAPVLSGATIALGAVRVGGTALVGSVVLADGTVASAYQESLIYQLGTALPGSLAVSNAVGTLVAGQTVAIGVTLSSAISGNFSGTALGSGATGAAFVSTGAGTSGLANTTLATPTLTVSGQVYATATASLSGTIVNFGVVHVGDVVNQATLTLTNGAAGALTDLLTGGSASSSGSYAGTVTPNTGGGLAAGASGSVTFGLGTGSSGVQNGSVSLGFLSHDGVLSDLGVNAAAVSVTGTVDSYATLGIQDFSGQAITGSGASYQINLGTLSQNGAVGVLTLGMLNAATGLSDLLSGGFTISGGGSAFTNVGFAAFSGLGAGQGAGGDTIDLATGTAGTFTETIVITAAGSNANYSGALPTETLTVTGVVNPSSTGPTYHLTPAPTTITATVGNDTFIATNGALNSRDYITGGPGGGNLLSLSGAGVFDLNAPKTLANINTVSATEGQVAGGGQPDTTQTVFLRDALNVTLTVGAGAINPSDPNPAGITIYGGNDSSVINLGTGHDTVVLGSAKEVVNGNTSGVDLVQATAAFAGALVKGTAGDSLTLEVTNAGTATLNAATTYATVQIDQASVITLSKASFITAIGEASGNTITALAKTQTLGGVAGSDTLVGYTGFTDTFRGSSAGLNHDVIKNFGGAGSAADVIDVTDLSYASAVKSYVTGSGQGVLSLTDGTHSTSITLVGSYTLAAFALSNDTHGGTLVKFV